MKGSPIHRNLHTEMSTIQMELQGRVSRTTCTIFKLFLSMVSQWIAVMKSLKESKIQFSISKMNEKSKRMNLN
jgi:hypothetical protein